MLKRLSRNRKGMMVFFVMVVIFTIFVLTSAFIQLSDKMGVGKELGETQMDAILTLQDGEKALIFLDFASKMALYQAVYDLQSQGGVSNSSECGSYYGFNRWNDDEGDTCFGDSKTAQDSLRDIFIGHLVARVAAYPSADFVQNVPTAATSRGAVMVGSTQLDVSSLQDGASGDEGSSSEDGEQDGREGGEGAAGEGQEGSSDGDETTVTTPESGGNG